MATGLHATVLYGDVEWIHVGLMGGYCEYGNEATQKELHMEFGYLAVLPVRVSEHGSKDTLLYLIFTNLVTTTKISLC
jgi:hypothetical protein